jgi:hypothetical protein
LINLLTIIRNRLWPERGNAAEVARRDRDHPELITGPDRLETVSAIHESHPPIPDPEEFDFNEEWYLQKYPDVAAHVRAGGLPTGLAHYLAHGRTEGRLITPPTQAAG